tara:strand:- start:68 stop:769 length:702 start_codon:yes stop_codon:yes gene_type:complete
VFFFNNKAKKMEAKSRLVRYEYYTHRNFNFFEFANYRNKTGKIMTYKDVNGLDQTLRFTSPVMLLDMNNEGHVLIDEFLKSYPAVRAGEWKRTDLQAVEEKQTKNTLDSARAIIVAAKMTDSEVKDFSILRGYNTNSDMDTLRAKIIMMAQTNAEQFMEVQFNPDKDLEVFLLQALKANLLNYRNNTYFYNKEAIGTGKSQVMVWLKKNQDILAILKHEMRGESSPKKKLAKK